MNKETNRTLVIRTLKIHRASLAFVLIGMLMLYLVTLKSLQGSGNLLEWLQLVGETMVVAGIVTLTYEFIVREETRMELVENIKSQLDLSRDALAVQLTEAVSGTVSHALLLDRDAQRAVLSEGKLDEIMLTCLSSRLEEDVSQELLTGVVRPVLDAFESKTQRIMYDYDLKLQLEETGDESIDDEFYRLYVTVQYSFDVKVPRLRFVCVNSQDSFRTFLADPALTYTYLLRRPDLRKVQFDVERLELRYQGKGIPLEKKVGLQTEGVLEICFESGELPTYVGKECRLLYKVSTLINKKGHNYFFRTKHPIRNLTATFDTGNTDITQVFVSDQFVASGGEVLQEQIVGDRIVTGISVDGWVFPNSGVCFVWHY